MLKTHTLADLFDCLAVEFAAEGRPGGDAAATALRNIQEVPYHAPFMPQIDPDRLRRGLAGTPFSTVGAILDRIPWRASGGGRIRADISQHLLTSELVGPTGLVHHDHLRIGLFYQDAHVNYVTRTHAAEETFVVLTGKALWSCDNSAPVAYSPGAQVHHPSMVPHATITQSEPLLAAWRWSGDIGFDSYNLIA